MTCQNKEDMRMEIFEAIMLICFGVSWPVSIYKSITARKTAGESLLFLYLILIGYASGIIYKASAGFPLVTYLYLFNWLMVLIDLLLFYRNRANENKQGDGMASRVART